MRFLCVNCGHIYDEAIGEYLKSETIYLKIGKKKGLANCYGNIGLIYFEYLKRFVVNDNKKKPSYIVTGLCDL